MIWPGKRLSLMRLPRDFCLITTFRFNSDTECNKRIVWKMCSDGAFQPVESQSLMVGHVVKVECDSEFPADVVLLQV